MTAPTVHVSHLLELIEVTEVERCLHCSVLNVWDGWMTGRAIDTGYLLHFWAEQAAVTA